MDCKQTGNLKDLPASSPKNQWLYTSAMAWDASVDKRRKKLISAVAVAAVVVECVTDTFAGVVAAAAGEGGAAGSFQGLVMEGFPCPSMDMMECCLLLLWLEGEDCGRLELGLIFCCCCCCCFNSFCCCCREASNLFLLAKDGEGIELVLRAMVWNEFFYLGRQWSNQVIPPTSILGRQKTANPFPMCGCFACRLTRTVVAMVAVPLDSTFRRFVNCKVSSSTTILAIFVLGPQNLRKVPLGALQLLFLATNPHTHETECATEV